MTYEKMQQLLMTELRLYHYPVAVKFFYETSQATDFKNRAECYHSPMKPITYCQWEIAARMKGQILYGEKKELGCSNALCSFGWKEVDQKEIDSHLKYTRSREQAERFVKTKARMPEGLIGVAVAPLAKAELFSGPDVVHFYCDVMQAYHLSVDYMAATGTHPLQSNITMNSAACGGTVWSYLTRQFNMVPMCSGSYNAGKTERGEINVMIPGSQIEAVCQRLKERIDETGASAITRPGDPFPGSDICKNCPLIVFKKEERPSVERGQTGIGKAE
jgi:uncharacterized protein (DUF169 family)